MTERVLRATAASYVISPAAMAAVEPTWSACTSADEVWAAIATGPGIDSWCMGRNGVESGPAGSVTTDVGGFVMTGRVTAWDPPNHFAYRSDGPGERFIAFEYLIEGRNQSSTVLRLIASGFLPDDDWETEFEAMTAGGEIYFRTLVAYLDHFAGRFVRVTVPGVPRLDGLVDFVNAQALGIRTADGLLRFIQGYIGSFVISHYRFTDPDLSGDNDKRTSQAWTTWLAEL